MAFVVVAGCLSAYICRDVPLAIITQQVSYLAISQARKHSTEQP